MKTWWYLGSPYTNYAGGTNAAAHEAAVNAGLLMDAGIPVFSPIAHFHAVHCAIGDRPHAFCMEADQPFMDTAHGLIVLELAGWRESRGLSLEITHFWKRGKQIIHMTPDVVPPLWLFQAGTP